MSALRGSRSAASLSAAIAPFQSSATSAFLPAAKSGSSCAQSASDPIVSMVVQIGQSSSGIFASAFRSGAPSHAAMELRHGNSMAADRPAAATSAPSTTANMIQRIIVAQCAPSAGARRQPPADFLCCAAALSSQCQKLLGLPGLRAFGIGVLGQLHELAVILRCLLAVA